MKILADWDEAYPALFLHVEGDAVSDYSRRALERDGTEVPDELAERWRKTRDDWRALGMEVARYLGRVQEEDR